MKIYRIAISPENISRDPNNQENVILYHATRKPVSIRNQGILRSVAGVLQKGGGNCVYTSINPQVAKLSVLTEEDLKLKFDRNYKKSKGQLFLVKISVPLKDIEIRSNNDVILNRDILPYEILDIYPA